MKTTIRAAAALALVTCATVALPSGAASRDSARVLASEQGVPPINWSGGVWIPRASATPAPPYGQYYNPSPDSIYVDASGRLHMWLRQVNGIWTSSMLQSVQENFGYGTYTWTIDTPMSAIDPNEVLGLFTFDSLPPKVTGNPTAGPTDDPRYVGHAETDIEMGPQMWRKGGGTLISKRQDRYNAQFVVQPWYRKNHTRHLALPTSAPMTVQFVWGPATTTFTIWRGDHTTGRPMSHWSTPYSNGSPKIGTRVAFNIWLFKHHGPARGVDQEVIIKRFSYQPSPSPVG